MIQDRENFLHNIFFMCIYKHKKVFQVNVTCFSRYILNPTKISSISMRSIKQKGKNLLIVRYTERRGNFFLNSIRTINSSLINLHKNELFQNSMSVHVYVYFFLNYYYIAKVFFPKDDLCLKEGK